MSLTNEQVWAAADGLEARGAPTTLVDVRTELGGGSFSTISRAMRIRKDRRPLNVDAPMAPMPHALAERLAVFGKEVWATAMVSSNERLEVDRAQFDQARRDIEADRDEVASLATQATVELDASHLRIQSIEATAEALRGEVHELNTQVGQLSERLAAAAAHAEESARRVGDLNRELERVHAANVDLIRALADQSAQPDGETGPKVAQRARRRTGATVT